MENNKIKIYFGGDSGIKTPTDVDGNIISNGDVLTRDYVDKEKYDFGNNSGYLVSSIPEKTSSFQLVYFDNEVEKTINFKEK